MQMQPKNGIVTGAASGLGRALCRRLARDGWRLAACDVNLPGAEETVDLVRREGGDGIAVELDVADRDAWVALEARLKREWDALDLLVNNAGVAGSGAVGEYGIQDWHWLLNVNLYGVIYGCDTFVPWLKVNPRGGHIINTASAAAFVTVPYMAAYNVSKAGIVALSESLYAELRDHRVGVTVLCPWFFETNLLKQGRFNRPAEKDLAEEEFRKSRCTADDVAEHAVRAIRRKRLYVVLPRTGRWLWYLKRSIPALFMMGMAGRMAIKLAGASSFKASPLPAKRKAA